MTETWQTWGRMDKGKGECEHVIIEMSRTAGSRGAQVFTVTWKSMGRVH